MELICIGFLGGVVFCLVVAALICAIESKNEGDFEETEVDMLTTELNNLKTVAGLSRTDKEVINKALDYIIYHELQGKEDE